MKHPRIGTIIGIAWLCLVVAFIYAPLVVVIGASIDPGRTVGFSAYLQFPPRGFSLRWYQEISPAIWSSLWLSVKLGASVAVTALAIGVPTALGLTRATSRLAMLADTVFRVPLQVPVIVTSIALLQSYYALTTLTGLPIAGSFLGLFVGHVFVATPYAIGAVAVSLRRVDRRLEEAAIGLGFPYWRVLLKVTLPLAAPGVFGGVLYAFLMSFTDVTLSIFLSGAGLITLPVWVINAMAVDLTPSVPAISTVVLIGSLIVVYLLQRLLGVDSLIGGGTRSA